MGSPILRIGTSVAKYSIILPEIISFSAPIKKKLTSKSALLINLTESSWFRYPQSFTFTLGKKFFISFIISLDIFPARDNFKFVLPKLYFRFFNKIKEIYLNIKPTNILKYKNNKYKMSDYWIID